MKSAHSPASWFIVLFVLALLVSCTSKPENAIVGKWRSGTETAEFLKDGRVVMANQSKGFNMAGKYQLVDNGRIKIDFGGMGGFVDPIMIGVTVSGDELTLAMPDGKVLAYTRAK
jgi:hypothetical protein